MEVEKTLSPETLPPGANTQPPANTDGLAAQVATGARTPEPTAPAPQKHPGGRPPTHGRYTKAAGSNGKKPVKFGAAPADTSAAPPAAGGSPLPETPLASPASPRVTVPADLLARVVKQALTVAENVLSNKISAKAIAAGLTDAEIEPQLEQCRLIEAQKDMVADLAPYVLEEWGVDAQVSPTVAVCLVLGPWLYGAVSAYSTLGELAKDRLAMLKASQPKDTKP